MKYCWFRSVSWVTC